MSGQEVYWLGSESTKEAVINRINEIDINGSMKCVISESKGKSARQRNLQWAWYDQVAKSGKGRDDDKDDVHIRAKYQFARPILLRDDEMFAHIWAGIYGTYANEPEALRYAAAEFMSTEKFTTSQMAEYLTEFEKYWRPHVDLLIPQDKDLLRAA